MAEGSPDCRRLSRSDAESLRSVLGEEPRSARLLRENKYCRIFSAQTEDGPVVVKRYLAGARFLEEREAAALQRYEQIATKVPELIPGRLVGFDPSTRAVATTFLEGELMSTVLRRAASDSAARRGSVDAMETIGRVLRELRQTTRQPGTEPDPFFLEYLQHVTAGLRRVPVVGSMLVRDRDGDPAALWGELARAGGAPSFSHGDLVFANILISGPRVGLIDWANTNERGHLLADLYGLRIALDAKPLQGSLRSALTAALERGLSGVDDAPEAAHRFYREWHRRRWLYLQLCEGGPAGVAGVIRSWSRLRGWAQP